METRVLQSNEPDRFCAWCGEQIKSGARAALVHVNYQVVAILHEECGAAHEREYAGNGGRFYAQLRQRGLTEKEWRTLHTGRDIGSLPPGPWYVAYEEDADEEGFTGGSVYDRSDVGGVFYVDDFDQAITLAVPTTEAVAHCMAASWDMFQLLEELAAQHRTLNLSEVQVLRIRQVLRKAYGVSR